MAKNDEELNGLGITIKQLRTMLIGILVVCVLFSSVYTIPAGSRGVLTTFGKPDMIPKNEGIGIKVPFVQDITKMSVQTQKYEAELTAASQDLQDVNTKIAINYRIVPEEAATIYRDIGLGYADKVIYPLQQEINKATTAQYTAEELITKRNEVRNEMKDKLGEKLLPRGIIVEEISIIDFKFSPSFTQAVEQKVTAEQLKLKAVNDLERIKIEAEQKIASAQAEAESLRLQKEQVTSDLIKLRQIEMGMKAIEKWNGIMPLVTGGAMPFIDINSLTKAE
jgi:regulator of protease activity HflC (stomatin/prohibitin superfamily)